jgi:hypothetical protein
MKNLIPLALALACFGANAKDIRTCKDARVGIDNLILPASENSRTFYNNRVAVFAIDMIEPAAGSMGIAITLPDVEDISFGSSKCLAITNFASIDAMKASPSYDKDQGLLLSFPTKDFDFDKGVASHPGKPLKIRINLKKFKRHRSPVESYSSDQTPLVIHIWLALSK